MISFLQMVILTLSRFSQQASHSSGLKVMRKFPEEGPEMDILPDRKNPEEWALSPEGGG
jgi:hypothetical protein